MKNAKLNHNIWMLANAIQALTHANNSEWGIQWLKDAIENIELVLESLKQEMPF